MVRANVQELEAKAKEDIAQIQRVFQKIQQLIRIKLELNRRRDSILNQITQSLDRTSIDRMVRLYRTGKLSTYTPPQPDSPLILKLKLILEREKKVLGIIINEEDIETSNIYIAEQILAKLGKQNKEQKRAMEAELKKLGIKFSDLEAIAIVAMEILQKSKTILEGIRKRMNEEEKLIDVPTSRNLSHFLV